MLSPSEKRQLAIHDTLDPKARANLYYRIAQKVKKSLSELEEINHILCTIPEKNASHMLNDAMVSSTLQLSQNMIRILGYCPIRKGTLPGTKFVVRSDPQEISKGEGFKEFKIKVELPTPQDWTRQRLINNHALFLYNMGFISSDLIDETQWRDESTGFPLFDSAVKALYSETEKKIDV